MSTFSHSYGHVGGRVTARLTRGEGKGQWQSYRSSDTSPTMVFYRCPFCSLINCIQGGSIAADGRVREATICPTPLCRVSYAIQLDGWAHNAVEHPAAFALCQADGDGS